MDESIEMSALSEPVQENNGLPAKSPESAIVIWTYGAAAL